MIKSLFVPAAIAVLGIAIIAARPVSKHESLQRQAGQLNLTAPTKWVTDNAHTNVIFSVSHLVVSDVEGSFKSFDGSLEAEKADFSDAKIFFSIDVNSINTDNENRDKHLKSDDFFSAEKFPKIKFVSTSFQPIGGNKYKLTGDLTIKDVTKQVVFDVSYGGTVNIFGGTHIGFKAKTTINRFDYNLKWDKVTETGGMIVGKDVDITINIDLKKV